MNSDTEKRLVVVTGEGNGEMDETGKAEEN